MLKKSVFAALAVSACMFAVVPAAAETFTASNGVLSIDLPNENWKEMADPTRWIVLSDGGNMITVDHFSNGEDLPDMTVADDHYVNVYQAVFSTQNEVFVITGSLVDSNSIADVCNAILSAKVLKFDTKTAVKKEVPQASEFAVKPLDATMYVASSGLNVRMGCSTSDEIIGALAYGVPVKVTGSVQRNGADYGWYQIVYEQGTGYVAANFLSTTAPEKKTESKDGLYTGRVRTVYKADGTAVTLYEGKDGNWYDASGLAYVWVSETEVNDKNGNVLYLNKPQSSSITPAGEPFTAYWLNGNATTLTLYSDNCYYSSDWTRYTANGDGSYISASGSVLYNYMPNLAPAKEVQQIEVYSQGSGRPVTINFDGEWYSDNDGNDYIKQADGTFKDASGNIYGLTYEPNADAEKYYLISRGSGRPVTITFMGGAYLDEEGNEYIKQENNTFIDEFGAEYDLDPEYPKNPNE